jgi:hypothetical protein
MANESLQRDIPMSPVASKMMIEIMLLGVDDYKGFASGVVGMDFDGLCRAQITPHKW